MIDSFNGKFFFLSNSYPCKVIYEGYIYPSAEHAYQAAKTLDKGARWRICKAEYPSEAKTLGRKVKLRPDWNTIRVGIMEEVIRKKFKNNRDLFYKLQQTGAGVLADGDYWGNTYWGTVDGVGENHLGRLLMKIRGFDWDHL